MKTDKYDNLRNALCEEISRVHKSVRRGTYKRRIAWATLGLMTALRKQNLPKLLILYDICGDGYLRDLIHDCCMLLGLLYNLPYWALTQDWKTNVMKETSNESN